MYVCAILIYISNLRSGKFSDDEMISEKFNIYTPKVPSSYDGIINSVYFFGKENSYDAFRFLGIKAHLLAGKAKCLAVLFLKSAVSWRRGLSFAVWLSGSLIVIDFCAIWTPKTEFQRDACCSAQIGNYAN